MSSPSDHADGTGAFDTNAWHACDQKQYPVSQWYEFAARVKRRAQILLVPMASCAHVPPPEFQDSDLRRPMVAWFPGASDLRALPWAYVRVRGAAGRGCHLPAWLGRARFARSSYVNRALFGISTAADRWPGSQARMTCSSYHEYMCASGEPLGAAGTRRLGRESRALRAPPM